MRRLPRIPRPRAITQRACIQHQPILPASARRIATAAPRYFRSSTRCLVDDADKKKQEMLEAFERDRQSALKLQEEYHQGPGNSVDDVVERSRIRIPPPLSYAPVPNQLNNYAPATNGEELQEVGGVEGWWDQECNWNEVDGFEVFANQAVEDDAVKEVLLRQAVVECLAVLGKQGEQMLGQRWAASKESVMMAAGMEVNVGSDGDVTLKGDLDALLAGLEVKEKAMVDEVVAEELDIKDTKDEDNASTSTAVAEENGLEGKLDGEHNVVESLQNEEKFGDGWEESSEQPFQDDALLLPEEARELLTSQSSAWKKVSLSNPKLKFAVHKRFYQLAGIYIHDAKLALTTTAEQLLAMACTPPKPKKLVDEIERREDLLKLPNVKVFNRRITPIDKEIWQGRWKVIEDELVERGLPVTGTGKYDKAAEGKWLIGKRARGRHI